MSVVGDADSCFAEGMKHLDLSRGADSRSEYVGDLENAVACFDRALAIKRDHPGALREKGIALATLGRHADAVEGLAEAIRLLPDDADLWLERAGALHRLGRDEEALADCDATLKLRPGDMDAMFRRAESLEALNRDAEAVIIWDEILGRADLRTMNFHGRIVQLLGPDRLRLRALLSRAGALARLERHVDAIGAYRAAIENGALLGIWAADTFSAAIGSHEEARAAYQSYLEAHAGDPQACRTAGRIFLQARRSEDALAAYERAIALAPADADGWIGKAEALVQSGRRTEAIAAFREALRVKPGYLAASLRLQKVEKEIARSQSDAKGGP